MSVLKTAEKVSFLQKIYTSVRFTLLQCFILVTVLPFLNLKLIYDKVYKIYYSVIYHAVVYNTNWSDSRKKSQIYKPNKMKKIDEHKHNMMLIRRLLSCPQTDVAQEKKKEKKKKKKEERRKKGWNEKMVMVWEVFADNRTTDKDHTQPIICESYFHFRSTFLNTDFLFTLFHISTSC